MLKKLSIGIGVALAVLLLAAVALYSFGGMWPPSGEARAAYAAEVAAGRQPALPGRFTIPIPGCVCHSSDPVAIMQHSTRRIGECAGCHSRG